MKHLWFVILLLIVGCDTAAEETPYEEKKPLIYNRYPPRHVQTAHRFSEISVSERFACGLTPDGEAWCWGANGGLELGTETEHWLSELAVRVEIEDKVIAMNTGVNHSCALTELQQVYCWGSGRSVLGLEPDAPHRNLPTLLETDLRFVSIAAGEHNSCGIDETGNIYCWGADFVGALHGNGNSGVPSLVYEGQATQMSLGSSSWCSGWAVTADARTINWGCRKSLIPTSQVPGTSPLSLSHDPFVKIDKGGARVWPDRSRRYLLFRSKQCGTSRTRTILYPPYSYRVQIQLATN